MKRFVKLIFRSEQMNLQKITFCFFGTFFWVPIPVDLHEFALDIAQHWCFRGRNSSKSMDMKARFYFISIRNSFGLKSAVEKKNVLQKNSDISKIKEVLVIKGIFSELNLCVYFHRKFHVSDIILTS